MNTLNELVGIQRSSVTGEAEKFEHEKKKQESYLNFP